MSREVISSGLFVLSVVFSSVLKRGRSTRQLDVLTTHEEEFSTPASVTDSTPQQSETVNQAVSASQLGPNFIVVVIGGGIGGLATALALQRRGVKCAVYERDALFQDRKQGYGLTLSNTPNGGLAKLGILDECIRQDCNSNSHWVFNPKGEILGYYGRAFKPREKQSSQSNKHRGNLRIPRQDLRQLLLDRLAPNTVRWGRKCVHIEEDEKQGCVHVMFENGERQRADLVVGADGLRSRVRQLRDCAVQSATFPSAPQEIQYIGISVILGISRFQHPLLQQKGYYVLDGTHRLFTMPFREDQDGTTVLTMWQLSFSGLSEGEANLLKMSGARAQLAEAVRRTKGWFASAHDLICSTDDADIWSTPLYDREPMLPRPRRKRGAVTGRDDKGNCSGRVTVVGDACHPMSMFKGQGANQALEDAPHLVDWLLKEGKQFSSLTVPMRINHFEKEMKDRTSKWVKASRSASQFYHSSVVLEDECAYGIDGIDHADSQALLAVLIKKGITAAECEGNSLESKVLAEYAQLKTCL